MKRSFGLRPDDGRHHRLQFGTVRRVLGGAPRGKADNSRLLGRVLEQPGVGSCVPSACMTAFVETLLGRGVDVGFRDPSIRTAYRQCLARDRAGDYPLRPVERMPALADVGTQILTCVDVAGRYGVREAGPDVVVDGVPYATDCAPDHVAVELDQAETVATSHRLVVGAHTIPWSICVEDVCLALDVGILVVVGGWVASPFLAYSMGDPPLGAQDVNDPDGGGHATKIHSYDMAGGEVRLFGRNSWGSEWGVGGDFECTGAFLRQMWERYACTVEAG